MLDSERRDRLVRRRAIGRRGCREHTAMRRAAHQHKLGHSEREYPAAVLRHIAKGQRPPARAPIGNHLAINPHHPPIRRQQTEDRLEQGRFAFAVAAEHAQHFAGAEGEADMISDNPPGIAVAQILDREPWFAHDQAGRRPKANNHKNTGVPKAAVSTPSGNSTAPIVRAAVSTASRYPAPNRRLTGSSRANAGPTVSRARCGTTSPTHPMMPLAATAAEVINVAAAITTMRSIRVSRPRAVASSSPKVITSMRQRSRASGTNPIATAGNKLVRSRGLIAARLPSSQKVMAGSWL